MTHKHSIEAIYVKYQNGDKLSDRDLAFGCAYFKDVADKLSHMGPVFRLAFIEANRVCMALESFQNARKRQ